MSYLRRIYYYLREDLFQIVKSIFDKIWKTSQHSWPLNKKEKILWHCHSRRLLACHASTFLNRISVLYYWHQSYDFSYHCKITKAYGARLLRLFLQLLSYHGCLVLIASSGWLIAKKLLFCTIFPLFTMSCKNKSLSYSFHLLSSNFCV